MTLIQDTLSARNRAENMWEKRTLPVHPDSHALTDREIDALARNIISLNVFHVLNTLGLNLQYDGCVITDVFLSSAPDVDLVEVADGTSDIVVVTKGTEATYGIREVWGELEDMELVKGYMTQVCRQTVRDTPTSDVSNEDRLLRGRLIVEESVELLLKGFGYTLTLAGKRGTFTVDKADVKDVTVVMADEDKQVNVNLLSEICHEVNFFAKVVDALFGIPSDEVMREVMRSNFDKIWDDGKAHFREDGKNIKPPNHQPPDIARVLTEHGWDD